MLLDIIHNDNASAYRYHEYIYNRLSACAYLGEYIVEQMISLRKPV